MLIPFILNSEVVEKFPALRQTITQKLANSLPTIKSGKVFCGILWILGEYVEGQEDINEVVQEIRKVIGEIPIGASEQRALDEANSGEEEKDKNAEGASVPSGGGRPKVLADGTYATETAFTSSANVKLEAVKAAAKPPLRSEFGLQNVRSIIDAVTYSFDSRR
jgi:coatomer subunit beta